MRIPLPKAKRYRRLLAALSVLLILLALDLLWVRIDRHIALGYETTRLSSPLKPDGTPDYLQALNEEASAGVTDENNAARLLLPLFEPPSFGTERLRAGIYTGIHVPPPAHWTSDDNHFLRFDPYLRSIGVPEADDSKEYRELEESRETTWAADQHPHVAAWVARSRQALEVLSRAAEKQHYYIPYVPSSDNGPLYSMAVWSLGDIRSLLWASQSRAMLRFHNGDFAGALNDLRVARQMQLLVLQGVTIVEYVCGAEMDQEISHSMRMEGASLTAAQVRTLLELADSFPDTPHCARTLNFERYLVLDSLCYAAHSGQAGQRSVDPEDPQEDFSRKLFRRMSMPFIPSDFNDAMRLQNLLYDRWVFAALQPSYPQRAAAGQQLDQESERGRSRVLPSLFSGRAERVACSLYDPLTGIFRWEASVTAERTLTRIALALAGYHAEKKEYPSTLDALVPEWLTALPMDPFTDVPLHYSKTPDGYRLYSVGANGLDDDGRTSRQRDRAHPHADDLCVIVPPPTAP